MSETPPSGSRLSPALQFTIALVVVLGGVSLGSVIVLRQSGPGRSQRPIAPPPTHALSAGTNRPAGSAAVTNR